MSTQFKYLFTRFDIGPVTLRNRIVFLPHLTGFAENNLPSERHAYYYAERAKGGAGLIIGPSSVLVHRSALGPGGYVYGYDERVIPRYRKITTMVHQHGTKIFCQLQHPGSEEPNIIKHAVWAPSAIPDEYAWEMPKAMEPEDIKEVIDGFAKSAVYAKEGGFDGIDIKTSHDCLIRQFLSSRSNKRTDEYGGSLENRTRFAREVIAAVRKAVGKDFVVGIRLTIDELTEGGYVLNEGIEIAKRLADTKQIDYISPCVALIKDYYMTDPPMDVPLGFAVPMIAALKETMDLPIIAFGRINDPVQAENILANGQADLVGMARELLCDPEFPNKTRQGRLEDIRNCIACNQNCLGGLYIHGYVGCVHNPAAGREKELGIDTIKPAAVKKKVLIVGGGPAGMKAAEIAALRGHMVVLYEKTTELGGQVNIASKGANRCEFEGVARYLINQMKKLNVEVKLGIEASPELVVSENPDAVIIATGSNLQIPSIPGVDQKNVVTVWDVLQGKAEVGQNIVVVDEEGFDAATSTAELLADQGKKVEIITPHYFVGVKIVRGALPTADTSSIQPLYKRMLSKDIILTPNTKMKEIKGNMVLVFNVHSGRERTIEGVDTVVLAPRKRANDEVYFALKGKIKELYRIGDCVAPRKVDLAVWDGDQIARQL